MARPVTDLENYLFDLRGYLHLEQVLSATEVKDLNDCLDAIPPLEPGGTATSMPIPTAPSTASTCSRYTRPASPSSE